MKTLLIMRHAKSSWKHADLPDIERPLKKRGKKDAQRMGKILREAELVPQVILCSSAKRARATAEAIVEEARFEGEVQYLDALYMAEPETFLEILRGLPGEPERVMIIGHNPGLESALQVLSGRVEALPTSAVAYLALYIKEWKELDEEAHGDLVNLWKPHDLK